MSLSTLNSLLEIERGGIRARYPLIHGAKYSGLPAEYRPIHQGMYESYLQLEPDGRLYAVTKEQFGKSPPSGSPLSPYWVQPID